MSKSNGYTTVKQSRKSKGSSTNTSEKRKPWMEVKLNANINSNPNDPNDLRRLSKGSPGKINTTVRLNY